MIFEGGGVKGLAHAGALSAIRDAGFEIAGVAGTSAGAIVAALVSVGYKPYDLFDYRSEPPNRGVLDVNMTSILADKDKKKWNSIKKHFDKKRGFIMVFMGLLSNADFISSVRNRGVFGHELFVEWLDFLLRDRLMQRYGEDDDEMRMRRRAMQEDMKDGVKFRHIRMPLKIIATDVTNRSMVVFSNSNNEFGELKVAEAVAASISIPFVFKPRRIKNNDVTRLYVDGGLMSNFPVWVFDEDNEQKKMPIFGLKLVERNNQIRPHKESIIRYLADIAYTSVLGESPLETRRVENLHVIPLSGLKIAS